MLTSFFKKFFDKEVKTKTFINNNGVEVTETTQGYKTITFYNIKKRNDEIEKRNNEKLEYQKNFERKIKIENLTKNSGQISIPIKILN